MKKMPLFRQAKIGLLRRLLHLTYKGLHLTYSLTQHVGSFSKTRIGNR